MSIKDLLNSFDKKLIKKTNLLHLTDGNKQYYFTESRMTVPDPH
jgi:hypothetical protein